MSGQMVSQEKTKIYFSGNVSTQIRRQIVHQSGFAEVQSSGKYLGIPFQGKSPRQMD